jgi:hypothetical protein
MKRKHLIWICLGIAALLIRWLSAASLIEQWYSRGLFPGIRWLIDYLLASWIPFSLLYLFVIGLLIWGYWKWKKTSFKNKSWGQILVGTLSRLLAFGGALLFFFLVLWGYNYGRISIEDQLKLKLEPIDVGELRSMMEQEAEYLIEWRQKIPAATDSALNRQHLPDRLEKRLRQDLVNWLDQHDFPTVGRARVKRIYPKGIFMRFSSSGLYFPYTGEGQVDAGLHLLQWPHVMMHEMSHAYGFGDEGTCNFLAYLAGIESDDPFIAYAVHLDFYRTLATNYLRYEPDAYQEFRAALPLGIQSDLNAINDNLREYPDIMPRVRYAAYDTYLKAQGIKEGMQNYSRVIMLVKGWRALDKN